MRLRKILILASILSTILAACIVQGNSQPDPGISGTLQALEATVASQSTHIAGQATIISYLATRGPAAQISTPAPEPTPYYPVIGSVIIEDDICCKGGVAGETIELSAHFEARSPFGEVTHMRVHSGSGPQQVESLEATSAWEPFTETRTFSTQVALNWVGFFVSVQFRDATGNLSPVVWDEISIEGQPPPTP